LTSNARIRPAFMDVSQDWQLIIRYRCPQCGKRYVVAEWKENPKCRAESRSSPATQATVRSTQHSNPAKLITRAFHLQQKKPVRPFRGCNGRTDLAGHLPALGYAVLRLQGFVLSLQNAALHRRAHRQVHRGCRKVGAPCEFWEANCGSWCRTSSGRTFPKHLRSLGHGSANPSYCALVYRASTASTIG